MNDVRTATVATWLACGALWSMAAACGSSHSAPSPLPDAAPAGPYLTSLAVSGAPGSLVPSFSPGVYDYYVRCAAGTNALAVSMTASSGAKGSLVQPKTSASRAQQTISLNVSENQAIVAKASEGTASREYWIRCLPHDFPALRMDAHPSAGAAIPGYYLVGNTTVPTGEGGYAMVLDGNGVPVWYYEEPLGAGVYDVETLVGGAISFIPSPARNPFEIHRLDPWKTTYASFEGHPTDEHELRALPNGNYLVLQSPTETGVDLTGLTLPLAGGGTQAFGPNSPIVACNVQEVDPDGNAVWQWVATDHFDAVKDDTFLYPAENENGVLVPEPFHCNAIDVDSLGNLLVSARHMDSIFYIERSTGKVLWKMGGAKYTKDDATYVPVADPFFRQHDARFLSSWKSTCSGAGGSGQISVYDDETSNPGPARGVVYDVAVAAPNCTDSGNPTTSGATVAWQYKGTTSIPATGSFRVLADGSRTIGWGTSPGGFVFSEVDVLGNDLLDFYFTDDLASYRAIKVPLTTFDLSVLRSTAGGPPPSTSTGPSDSGATSDGSEGDDADDAGSINGSDGESSDATACYTLTGSGSTEQCNYSSSCSSSADAGSTPGSCPSSSGLVGCCVVTGQTDGGEPSLTATCYYSASTGATAESACQLEAYDDPGVYAWQSFAP